MELLQHARRRKPRHPLNAWPCERLPSRSRNERLGVAPAERAPVMGPRRISNGGSRWRSIAQLLWSFLASETSGGFYGLLASSFGQFSFGRVEPRRVFSPSAPCSC